MNENKSSAWKEWLISLIITLVMLGLVMGAQYLYTSKTGVQLEASAVWIGNLIGVVIMLPIVHHFVKKPKDKEQR